MRMASSVEQCELCRGLRCHSRLKNNMFDEFDREYKQLKRELKQLKEIFRHVCWYHFETQCKNWKSPWHESFDESHITLHGHCFCKKWVKGRYVEEGRFPIYYDGAVVNAPCLPPIVIFKEIEAVQEQVNYMKEARWAPYDYAPGGRKYEELLREGCGALAYKEMQQSSKRNAEEHGGRESNDHKFGKGRPRHE